MLLLLGTLVVASPEAVARLLYQVGWIIAVTMVVLFPVIAKTPR